MPLTKFVQDWTQGQPHISCLSFFFLPQELCSLWPLLVPPSLNAYSSFSPQLKCFFLREAFPNSVSRLDFSLCMVISLKLLPSTYHSIILHCTIIYVWLSYYHCLYRHTQMFVEQMREWVNACMNELCYLSVYGKYQTEADLYIWSLYSPWKHVSWLGVNR